MNPKPSVFRPVLAGLFVTLVQIFVAVVLIAPPGPLSFRYDTLIQHDSHWFANIVDRGYGTTVPPSQSQDDGGLQRSVFPGLSRLWPHCSVTV